MFFRQKFDRQAENLAKLMSVTLDELLKNYRATRSLQGAALRIKAMPMDHDLHAGLVWFRLPQLPDFTLVFHCGDAQRASIYLQAIGEQALKGFELILTGSGSFSVSEKGVLTEFSTRSGKMLKASCIKQLRAMDRDNLFPV